MPGSTAMVYFSTTIAPVLGVTAISNTFLSQASDLFFYVVVQRIECALLMGQLTNDRLGEATM
jgi:hypothetical protein